LPCRPGSEGLKIIDLTKHVELRAED